MLGKKKLSTATLSCSQILLFGLIPIGSLKEKVFLSEMPDQISTMVHLEPTGRHGSKYR